VAVLSILSSVRASLIACRGLGAKAQRGIVMSACAIALVGCGSNTAAPASGDAAPGRASSRASTGGDVPPTLRSAIASTLKIDEGRVTPAATFTSDLGADQLSMVELVMAYERVFKVDIPDADADRFKTVQDVSDYLRKRNVLR
jgi:acyl carrier protein